MNKLLTSGMWIGFLLTTCPLEADTTFTLDPPGGAISGLSGQTIGWGFTFTNDTDYAVITSVQFCDAASVLPGACLPVTPSLGTFTDFTPLQPLLVVGPSPESTTLTQSFDGALFTGVGSFAIDPSALGTVSGLIVVSYDLFKESPNDPQFTGDEVEGGLFLSAPASVSAVPEPSSWPLLLAGGLLIEISRRIHFARRGGSRRNQARAKRSL